MKEISLIKHVKGALGLRVFGLGPNLKPTKGLVKLQKLLDSNAFWQKIEQLMISKNVLLTVMP